MLRDVQKGNVRTFEMKYDIKDAQYRSSKTGMIHVQAIASGLKEEDGTISAYIAQIIDLTDRRTSLENSGDDE